ncbi:hypothetical protein B0H17DRAFT_1149698 [Mycena rosella]|uniref:Uncharacterized protein n=1 Tax=Mycena rosella TaxID=1033263 RepID=A0AAD7C0Q3_MYCRO|nr:hypothetical protein B0H17DRAFT_1149698 [Mycena rosella]
MWFLQERKTCRGTVFSPFWPPSATALCAATFDVAPLLRKSVELQSKYADDKVPDVPSDNEPPTDDELNSIDEESPHPHPRSSSLPSKHVRLEDVPRRLNHHHDERRDKRHQATVKDGQVPQAQTLRDQVASSSKPIPSKIDATPCPLLTARTAPSLKTRRRREAARSATRSPGLWDWASASSSGRTRRTAYHRRQGPHHRGPCRPAQRPQLHGLGRCAYAAFQAEAAAAKFPRSQYLHHRGGSFPALNVGMFHGKETCAPITLNNGIYNGLLVCLLANPHINRMAVYASCLPALPRTRHKAAPILPSPPSQLPKVHLFLRRLQLRARHLDIPASRCDERPLGWCAIQALGRFDPTKGGHLVLWDLELIIEFPAGATILLPSAMIAHSNIPVDVRNGEERASFMQYTPGGLLRFVDNEFCTETEFANEDPEGYLKKCEEKESRWRGACACLAP